MDLHIFGSPGRTSAEAELEIFRSPGRTDVWKPNFTSLPFGAERTCGSEASEVQKLNFISLAVKTGRKYFTSLEELVEQKCGTELMSHHG